jgi:hypothetical protein
MLKSARGGFNFFGNRRDKLEDAAEEFRNAANRYMGEQKRMSMATIPQPYLPLEPIASRYPH